MAIQLSLTQVDGEADSDGCSWWLVLHEQLVDSPELMIDVTATCPEKNCGSESLLGHFWTCLCCQHVWQTTKHICANACMCPSICPCASNILQFAKQPLNDSAGFRIEVCTPINIKHTFWSTTKNLLINHKKHVHSQSTWPFVRFSNQTFQPSLDFRAALVSVSSPSPGKTRRGHATWRWSHQENYRSHSNIHVISSSFWFVVVCNWR